MIRSVEAEIDVVEYAAVEVVFGVDLAVDLGVLCGENLVPGPVVGETGRARRIDVSRRRLFETLVSKDLTGLERKQMMARDGIN